MRSLFYIWNQSRAHKIIPLLEGYHVVAVRGFKDAFVHFVRRHRGTCVIVDSFGRFGLIGLLLSFLVGAPLVLRLRGDHYREVQDKIDRVSRIRYVIAKFIADAVLRSSKMIIFNSHYLEGQMRRLSRENLTDVVYNPFTPLKGSDANEVMDDLPKGDLKLLSVANFNLYTKVEPIFTAIQEWINSEMLESLDIQWVILGKGYHVDSLRTLIRTAGLEKRIHFIGYSQDIGRYYEWCDLMVHLTRMDAFPNCTLEAMAHARPVITNADSCGTLEQVSDRYNGILVHDAGSFIDALNTYANSPELRSEHGKHGREVVEHQFDVVTQRKRMENALQKLEANQRSSDRSNAQ